MIRYLTATLAAGAAILGLAAASPAQARDLPMPSDAAYAVPAGKIEHRVALVKVSGRNAIASHTKTETWLTRTTSRTVVTDVRTGKLKAETVAMPKQLRTYNAETGVLTIEKLDKPRGLPENSATFEAAVQKAYVEQDITRVVGETVIDGRRALITRSVEKNWRTDEPGGVTTAVVDAETFALYARSTVNESRGFRQDEMYSTELITASAANRKAKLAMKKRRHAKIRRR
jgi:hypothetical protein